MIRHKVIQRVYNYLSMHYIKIQPVDIAFRSISNIICICICLTLAEYWLVFSPVKTTILLAFIALLSSKTSA